MYLANYIDSKHHIGNAALFCELDASMGAPIKLGPAPAAKPVVGLLRGRIRHPSDRASLINLQHHSASKVARPSLPLLRYRHTNIHTVRASHTHLYAHLDHRFQTHRTPWPTPLTTTHGKTKLVPPATTHTRAKATQTPTHTRPTKTKLNPATHTPRKPLTRANTNLRTTHHPINNPSLRIPQTIKITTPTTPAGAKARPTNHPPNNPRIHPTRPQHNPINHRPSKASSTQTKASPHPYPLGALPPISPYPPARTARTRSK
jgi:hypothetical protein